MPAKTVKAAIDELKNAVQSLENAIDSRFDRERDLGEFEGEVRRSIRTGRDWHRNSTNPNSGQTDLKRSTARFPDAS